MTYELGTPVTFTRSSPSANYPDPVAAPPETLELLARPCPRCGGQLVRLIGCGCGCGPIAFCLTHDCRWVDPANRQPREDTRHGTHDHRS